MENGFVLEQEPEPEPYHWHIAAVTALYANKLEAKW
jgi:hypothetical protein